MSETRYTEWKRHKDYAAGIPIQISVYPDKLMIWNPGQLPQGWDLDSLLDKHASIPYNPTIAGVFFRAGMIESWGRGIERIMASCREAGAPKPTVEIEATGVWMTLRYVSPRTQEPPGPTHESSETPVETPIKLGETPKRILELLAANPGLTLAEVAETMGKSLRAVERASAKLVDQGCLRFVGPRKGGHWEVIGGDNG